MIREDMARYDFFILKMFAAIITYKWFAVSFFMPSYVHIKFFTVSEILIAKITSRKK